MKPKNRMTKAAFIRQFPDRSAQWVVNSAVKTEGMTMTVDYVHKSRSRDSMAETEESPKQKAARTRRKLAKTMPKPVIRMSDINIDPAFNQRAAPEPVVLKVTKASGDDILRADMLKVSGDGLVRAFKAMVVAIGTRVARQLVTQVEDETSKLFGRPPL